MLRSIRVAMFVFFALATAATAQESPPEPAPCTSGVFIVQGDPLLPSTAADGSDAVILKDGTVAIASGCPPVQADIRRGPAGTIVHAQWRECRSGVRLLRLRARIEPTCSKMAGAIAAVQPQILRRFRAVRCDDLATCRHRCERNADCRDAAYCAKQPGQCDGTGVCDARPDACPANADPVCGCDGQTYGNACEAAAAGVNVRKRGRCEVTCDPAEERPCTEGQFCEVPAGICASADVKGLCVDVPTGCPDVFDPVCGCDHHTYGNDCERRAAGVSKAHNGACLDDVCELICASNDDCRPAAYCAKRPGQCDTRGLCQPQPTACTDEYAPVCGCDGKTYANRCDAAARGANVAHRGPCREICGTIAGIPCPTGHFCEFRPGTCDSADQAGMCFEIPQACPRILDPVCGCDGKTYGNDCERQRAQVALDHKGSCLDAVSLVR